MGALIFETCIAQTHKYYCSIIILFFIHMCVSVCIEFYSINVLFSLLYIYIYIQCFFLLIWFGAWYETCFEEWVEGGGTPWLVGTNSCCCYFVFRSSSRLSRSQLCAESIFFQVHGESAMWMNANEIEFFFFEKKN